MKISKKSQYGLRAMLYLANSDKEFISLREISEKENISFSYLEKILSQLEKSGLVNSKKGAQGGYSLARKKGEIDVGQILKALGEKILLIDCISSSCQREGFCQSATVWKRLQSAIEKTISSITLDEKDILR